MSYLRTHTRVPGSGAGRGEEKVGGKGSGGVVVMNRSALVDEIVLRPPQVVVTILTNLPSKSLLFCSEMPLQPMLTKQHPPQPSSSPRRKSSVPITLFDSLRIRWLWPVMMMLSLLLFLIRLQRQHLSSTVSLPTPSISRQI